MSAIGLDAEQKTATGAAGGVGQATPAATTAALKGDSAGREERARSTPGDVWSRTAPKYRIRALVLLFVNLVVFAAMCMFVHWLHVARPVDFSLESYVEPFRFWGPQTHTLNDFVLYPINVADNPVHAIVLGLLFATLISVPISVAILYRLPSALPFVACVLLLAHLPWLALTLCLSCVLASVRPFRMPFRYGSALVGLLPVAIYFVLAARGDLRPVQPYVSPHEKQMLAAPWALAILGACAMLAAILGWARLVAYRPGVIAPASILMFVMPAVLFARYVGADELAFRVLQQEWGLQSQRVEPTQDARPRIIELLRRWSQSDLRSVDPDGETFLGLWAGNDATRRDMQRRIVSRFVVDLLEQRRSAYEACKSFIAEYPTSRYVPYVLAIQSYWLDLRLAEERLLGTNPTRELYADFPHVQSLKTWERLVRLEKQSALGALAGLRLGQLRLRSGELAGSLQVLDAAAGIDAAQAQSSWREGASSRTGALNIAPMTQDLASYVLEARQLAATIRANCDDPQYGAAPLVRWARLDPRRPGYGLQLRELIARYPDALMLDNFLLAWIETEDNLLARADGLVTLVCRFADGDIYPAAAFALGELEMLRLARDDPRRLEHGVQVLTELLRRAPADPWAAQARELLARLRPAASRSAVHGERP